MASLPLSRSSSSSSSDSDDSQAILASVFLQEIPQEDLAAILPDQQECDEFDAFGEPKKDSPAAGDASGSDMELPQQAVNALIQRTTESSSESESHPPPNPGTLYANSLLQQFVQQTQMINTTQVVGGVKEEEGGVTKRKRGRPKKVVKKGKKGDYCDPNVSPDSGIQNSPDHVSSPDCSPLPKKPPVRAGTSHKRDLKNVKAKDELSNYKRDVKSKDEASNYKRDVKVKVEGSHKIKAREESRRLKELKSQDDSKIHVKTRDTSSSRIKSREQSLNRLKSQGETVKSRNESLNRNKSRTDNKIKTRDETNNKTKTKDESSINKVKTKDETSISKIKSKDETVTNKLKIKDESSTNKIKTKDETSINKLKIKDDTDLSYTKTKIKDETLIKTKNESPYIKTKTKDEPANYKQKAKDELSNYKRDIRSKDELKKADELDKKEIAKVKKPKTVTKDVPAAKQHALTSSSFDRILYGNADRVLYPPRRKVGRPPLKKGPGRPPKHRPTLQSSENKSAAAAQAAKKEQDERIVLATKNKLDRNKHKYLMLKNAKLMHSKHKHKKHKKCKFKILKPLTAAITQADPKLNIEIEKLVQDFVKLCTISPARQAKENVPDILKALKKVAKKRKTSEHGERKKKKQNQMSTVNKEPSSNEQRLPLKKRHYHLTSETTTKSDDDVKTKSIEVCDLKPKLLKEEMNVDDTNKLNKDDDVKIKPKNEDSTVEVKIETYITKTKLRDDDSAKTRSEEIKIREDLQSKIKTREEIKTRSDDSKTINDPKNKAKDDETRMIKTKEELKTRGDDFRMKLRDDDTKQKTLKVRDNYICDDSKSKTSKSNLKNENEDIKMKVKGDDIRFSDVKMKLRGDDSRMNLRDENSKINDFKTRLTGDIDFKSNSLSTENDCKTNLRSDGYSKMNNDSRLNLRGDKINLKADNDSMTNLRSDHSSRINVGGDKQNLRSRNNSEMSDNDYETNLIGGTISKPDIDFRTTLKVDNSKINLKTDDSRINVKGNNDSKINVKSNNDSKINIKGTNDSKINLQPDYVSKTNLRGSNNPEKNLKCDKNESGMNLQSDSKRNLRPDSVSRINLKQDGDFKTNLKRDNDCKTNLKGDNDGKANFNGDNDGKTNSRNDNIDLRTNLKSNIDTRMNLRLANDSKINLRADNDDSRMNINSNKNSRTNLRSDDDSRMNKKLLKANSNSKLNLRPDNDSKTNLKSDNVSKVTNLRLDNDDKMNKRGDVDKAILRSDDDYKIDKNDCRTNLKEVDDSRTNLKGNNKSKKNLRADNEDSRMDLRPENDSRTNLKLGNDSRMNLGSETNSRMNLRPDNESRINVRSENDSRPESDLKMNLQPKNDSDVNVKGNNDSRMNLKGNSKSKMNLRADNDDSRMDLRPESDSRMNLRPENNSRINLRLENDLTMNVKDFNDFKTNLKGKNKSKMNLRADKDYYRINLKPESDARMNLRPESNSRTNLKDCNDSKTNLKGNKMSKINLRDDNDDSEMTSRSENDSEDCNDFKTSLRGNKKSKMNLRADNDDSRMNLRPENDSGMNLRPEIGSGTNLKDCNNFKTSLRGNKKSKINLKADNDDSGMYLRPENDSRMNIRSETNSRMNLRPENDSKTNTKGNKRSKMNLRADNDDSKMNLRPQNESSMNLRPENDSRMNTRPGNDLEMSVKDFNDSKTNLKGKNKSKMNLRTDNDDTKINLRPEKESSMNLRPENDSKMNLRPEDDSEINVKDINDSKLNLKGNKRPKTNLRADNDDSGINLRSENNSRMNLRPENDSEMNVKGDNNSRTNLKGNNGSKLHNDDARINANSDVDSRTNLRSINLNSVNNSKMILTADSSSKLDLKTNNSSKIDLKADNSSKIDLKDDGACKMNLKADNNTINLQADKTSKINLKADNTSKINLKADNTSKINLKADNSSKIDLKADSACKMYLKADNNSKTNLKTGNSCKINLKFDNNDSVMNLQPDDNLTDKTFKVKSTEDANSKIQINNHDLTLKTRKYNKVLHQAALYNNNNDELGDDGHIEDEIEACINKFDIKIEETANEIKVVHTTTPKKRHRLEMIKEESLSAVENAKRHIAGMIITRKKNRLEDLATNLANLKRDAPIGIFTPTIDLDVHLSEDIKPPTMTSVARATVPLVVKTANTKEVRKKVRKRRAINRTGFPTVKKKKKKIVPPEPQEVVPMEVVVPECCDRVPKDGEEYSSFVERTEFYNVSKWEVLSECDSLPQEERIDFDPLDVKTRDFSPDLHSSELDDLTLEMRLKKLKKTHKHKRKRETLERKCNENLKKRLRDVSPASSIEKSRFTDDRASASGDELNRKCRKPRKPPYWRRKYLVAGLFSDYYKEDKRDQLSLVSTKPAKLTYVPEEHPYGLLPPPYHCGKYLRRRKTAFQLPYDLWWKHTHNLLQDNAVPSWNYRKIRTNFYNVKNTAGVCEPQSCNCTVQTGCGDDCINRIVFSECPAAHKCKNQKIQKHEWAPGIEKFMTENKGWGVKTNLPIRHGEFILEYVGEVVSDQEFKERMATRYIHDTHHYCLHLDGGLVIDGHRMGGDGRFVNHSCEPNCEMQKWSVNGQFRMALFALRDINGGEELTYDYNFSLFNAAEGQECKCGSDICRGVIGGKSQRVRQVVVQTPAPQPGRVGRPRKNQAKKATSAPVQQTQPTVQIPQPQLKPISHAQRLFVLEHRCFLLRNLKKLRRSRDTLSIGNKNIMPVILGIGNGNQSTTNFLNHLNALRQPRNMKTRRLAQGEDDPELKKTVQLANVMRDIYNAVTEAKDEKNEKLCTHFMLLPSKRKHPDYYTKITDPIDLTTVEQNIDGGIYKTVESFDADMSKFFANNFRYYGRTSDMGVALARLRKIYNDVKKDNLQKFEDVLGVKPTRFMGGRKKSEEEDIIRCICGMYRDEGLMIQCERCLVWQHCECVQADENTPSYHCEKCVPREVDYEIPMDEFTEHGHQYYMTLLRDDLQLRQGDTVYVLRDIPIPGTDKKHTYDTIGEIKYTDLDIFRIERLWKDCKSGQRFAYGHHYLRPHETYHEPTRKFFQNEVMRVPLYEAVPVELIISHCWVMDLNTFCKGRPIGAPEEHIYICEYRVDKSARLFSKVSKSKFPVCSKSYAFERFDQRLKITRTYTPHDLDPAFVKQRGRKPQEVEQLGSVRPVIPVIRIRTPAEQKTRLNNILLKLLNGMPTKQPLDVSYLLEGGRRRKKER